MLLYGVVADLEASSSETMSYEYNSVYRSPCQTKLEDGVPKSGLDRKQGLKGDGEVRVTNQASKLLGSWTAPKR